MEMVGGGDGDGLDLWVLDQRLPIAMHRHVGKSDTAASH
jgi:hypothetical protein